MRPFQRDSLLVIGALVLGVTAGAGTPAARQQEVAQKGAMVMPFDIHVSDHVFQKTSTGGIQQVTAKDPKDQALVAAIRAELEKQAGRFGSGDYAGSLAGKYLIKLKPGEVAIVYRNVAAGAAVDYTGKDAAAVAAIHAWLDAEIDAQYDAAGD